MPVPRADTIAAAFPYGSGGTGLSADLEIVRQLREGLTQSANRDRFSLEKLYEDYVLERNYPLGTRRTARSRTDGARCAYVRFGRYNQDKE